MFHTHTQTHLGSEIGRQQHWADYMDKGNNMLPAATPPVHFVRRRATTQEKKKGTKKGKQNEQTGLSQNREWALNECGAPYRTQKR